MDAPQILDICAVEDGSVRLGRTPEGELFSFRDGRWERYDFNGIYRGCYPACVFTALARAGGLFCLAGLDGEGAPHVFSSLLGGVWEERNLTARHPLTGARRLSGRVIRILFDGDKLQLFLLCANGELATLPDCPRCVRITDIPGGPVEDGWLDGRDLAVRLAGGAVRRINVDSIAQYRVSGPYLTRLLACGGVLVDLRSGEESAAAPWPGSVHVPLEDVEDWLESRDRDVPVVFFCRTGVNAERTARYARLHGFTKAYALDGADRIM